MEESKIVRPVVATIAFIAFSVPALASADKLKERRSEKVSYADLNLETEAGARSLYRRLQRASKRVCGVESIKNAGGIRVFAQQQRCYRDTLDEAVADIDSPTLTAVHSG